MRYFISLTLLLPLIITGAGTKSSLGPCNCGEFSTDTTKLKKIIDAKVDSFMQVKLQALEEIKQQILDSSNEPSSRLWLGRVDHIRTLWGYETSKWYYRITGKDTSYVKRVVVK